MCSTTEGLVNKGSAFGWREYIYVLSYLFFPLCPLFFKTSEVPPLSQVCHHPPGQVGLGAALCPECPGQTGPSCKCRASGDVGVRAAEPSIIHLSLPHNYLCYPRELRTPLSLPASHFDSNWDLKTLETWVGGSVHYCWWMVPWVMCPADPQRSSAWFSSEELSFLFSSTDLLFTSAN